MADNFNIQTTQQEANEAGGLDNNNPAMTYVDFANQIAKNSQTQQAQQALIDQAKLALQQKQNAASLGVNPELKDFLSVDEAVAELKAAGVDDDTIQSFVQALGNQQEVSRQSVDTVIRKKQLGEKQGQAFIATDQDAKNPDMKDENGKPLTAGQSYAAQIDQTSGEVMYVRSGGEGLLASQGKNKDAATSQKRKTDLVNKIVNELEAKRGNWLSQGLYRCSVALQKLSSTPNMTKQDLYQVAQDIAAIFTGGVPTEEEILKTVYGTKLNDVLGTIGSLTGKVFGLPLNEIREKLITIVQPLYDEMINRFTNLMNLRGQGYLDVIDADPQWWNDTKQKAITAAEHQQNIGTALTTGNLMPIGSGIPPVGQGQNIPTAGAAPSTPQASRPSLQDIFGGQ
jgi:hypothetical protein